MQFSVDTIANNLANVSTYGYKKERPEFQDLLYVTMQKAVAPTEEDPGQPVNLQVGHGVLPRATVRDFTMGNLEQTANPLDMAVEGDGFFQIQMPDGTVRYTRDGAFKLSVTEEGNMITTRAGFPCSIGTACPSSSPAAGGHHLHRIRRGDLSRRGRTESADRSVHRAPQVPEPAGARGRGRQPVRRDQRFGRGHPDTELGIPASSAAAIWSPPTSPLWRRWSR